MRSGGAFRTNHTRSARLGALFEQALDLPVQEREPFVSHACEGDAALRDELISLLEAHLAAGAYFDDLSRRAVAPALSAVARQPDDAEAMRAVEKLRERLADTYRFEQELGGGGMSRIFVAEDPRLKRRVVIKVLPPEIIPTDAADRFQREIELAAQLQHPHIVPLLSTDTVDGTSYYTMPFVTGESLRDRLARDGALPLDDALRIWRDLLDALAHAHARGVVHRDIKPGNILLSGRHALVTDFGIALALETAAGGAQSTTRGPAIGTAAYMAPEQAAAKADLDQRVDLYQAGLVMYEMLTGVLPFEAESTHELLLARITREPAPLLRREAPDGLVALVTRCLARARRHRPESAEAVLAELDLATSPPPGKPTFAAVAVAGRPRRTIARYAGATLALVTVVSLAMVRPSPRSTPGGAAGSLPASITASGPRRTPDIAAYEWYRRGMDVALLRTDRGRREGIAHFERAISIDSMYAAAYAGLSRMYLTVWNASAADERRTWARLAEEAAFHAVALDDTEPMAHVALGWVRLATSDYGAAEAALTRALDLSPVVPRGHEGLARVHMMTGRRVEQLAEARLGVEADPFSHSAIRELSLALATNDRCEEALDGLRTLKTLTPPAAVAGVIGGMCYASREMWPEAISELQWAASQGDNSATFAPAFTGYSLARAGRQDEASALLSELLARREQRHGSFAIATVYTGMRDYDEAFAWLDRAVDDGSLNPYIMHPIFADLHRDPRFQRLKERMGVESPR